MDKVKTAWFPMRQEASGATGTLIKSQGYIPFHDGTLVYFSVEDIEGVLSRVNEKGGKTYCRSQA